MPSPHNPHQINLEIEIEASPERVWKHLTTVDDLKHASLFDDTAKTEPHVGGRYSFGWAEMESEKKDGPGHITDWVVNEKLRVSGYGGRDSPVSRDLARESEKATRIQRTHTGLQFSPAN